MSSTCLVSARDYRRYWGEAPPDPVSLPYTGLDRRASAERRAPAHDRRWDAHAGRRRRGSDRRRAR